MHAYASGAGHNNLAEKLKISTAVNLSQSGGNNSRMIRTVLKDSFLTTDPTLYVIGLTFISRSEVPICCIPSGDVEETSFEGRWTNPQNQMYSDRWEHFWTQEDTDRFVELKLKEEVVSLIDRTEDLMYRLVSMIHCLESRQHKVLIYQQADSDYFCYLDTPRLALFKKYLNFINGLKWCAIPWQHEQGIPFMAGDYSNRYGNAPENIRHRQPGKHALLNKFLTDYIKEYKILE